MPDSTLCLVCCRPCDTLCPSCFAPVCAPDQPVHRPQSACQPWRVSSVAGVGRVLVATRDIRPWELVLEDSALVTVPDDQPVCLGCLGPLDGRFTCGECQWPICDPSCSQNEQHRLECGIFRDRNTVVAVKDYSSKHTMYSCVAVLRVLLLKGLDGRDSVAWKQVEELMSHWETRRREAEVAEAIRRMTIFFVERLGLAWVREEDVQQAFGVLKTNAVGFMHTEARALYPIVSIMSHSCAANLEPVADPGSAIRFRAKRQIKAGEELCMRYTTFLDSIPNIRKKLKAEWFFDCRCSRCEDPTEFGSYFSSPKCVCGGYLLANICQSDDRFTCDQCGTSIDCREQRNKDKIIEDTLQNATLDQIHAMYTNIKRESGYHPHYHTVFKLGERLLVLGQKTEDAEMLQDTVEAGGHVIQTLRMLDKGCSRLLGRLMLLQVSSQQQLLAGRKRDGRLEEADYVGAAKELALAKIRALKMASSFFTGGKMMYISES